VSDKSALEILRLTPRLTRALGELFREILERGDDRFFNPHPFTQEQATAICTYAGRDEYYGVVSEDRIVGYGMLRGWDEGYEIPSLGIYIRAEARGRGLGELLMGRLHTAASVRGATRIRLKVDRRNHVARNMYEKLGYTFRTREGEQLVGYCMISPMGTGTDGRETRDRDFGEL